MRYRLIALLTVLLVSAVVLRAYDGTSGSAADSTGTPTPKTAEQMMAEMQQQLYQMQLKLDQIQSAIPAPEKNETKDLIPSWEKRGSKFYWSIQFGFFLQSDEYYTTSDQKQKLGTRFSFALKPAFGYLFNDRMTAGCTIVVADCNFAGIQSSASWNYLIVNSLIGAGASLSDYFTWHLRPYFRYRFTRIFWDRLNLWGEASCYAGMSIPKDTNTKQLQGWDSSVIYGVSLRPMLTLDLNKNLMLFTTMELLSWNGSYKMDNGTALQNNSFNFQFVPIYSILSGLFNIGLIRRF